MALGERIASVPDAEVPRILIPKIRVLLPEGEDTHG